MLHHCDDDNDLGTIACFYPDSVFLQIGGNDIVPLSEEPMMEQTRRIVQGITSLAYRILGLGVVGWVYVGEVLFRARPRGMPAQVYNRIRSRINRHLVVGIVG